MVDNIEHYKNKKLEDIVYFCEIDNIEKTEIWKDVPEWEGFYKVSNLSRIKSLERVVFLPTRNINRKIKSKILSWNFNCKKYPMVGFHYKKEIEVRSLHIIIGNSFIENPLNLPFLNHKNGIKTDPRISNLEWCTHLENMVHAFSTGLVPNGERNHKAILTDYQVRIIKRLFRINPKTNQRAICRKLNISPSVINAIYKGRKWKYIN